MRERFQRVLRTEMQKRGSRLDVSDSGDGPETYWVQCERHRMYEEVNRARAEQGHDPVSLDVVKRVEQMACGHVDYFEKFTLYCAELALGVTEPRP